MSQGENSLNAFTEVLGSKAAVPGGGGASALVGAVGTALAAMVGNLTTGKKKYAAYEPDIQNILVKAESLRKELLGYIDADAEAFEPLSKAYGIPKEDPSRAATMEMALRAACTPPLEIMRACCRAIELHTELAEKGSALALSDVGVGVAMCGAALKGASLNIFINTKSMSDRDYAAGIEAEANSLLEEYVPKADKVFADVFGKLR